MVDGGTMVAACSNALGSEVDGSASHERDVVMRCGFVWWALAGRFFFSFSLGLG